MYLYYSADMKLTEIAECLHLSVNTVKTRLRKAKSLLKENWRLSDMNDEQLDKILKKALTPQREIKEEEIVLKKRRKEEK